MLCELELARTRKRSLIGRPNWIDRRRCTISSSRHVAALEQIIGPMKVEGLAKIKDKSHLQVFVFPPCRHIVIMDIVDCTFSSEFKTISLTTHLSYGLYLQGLIINIT